MFFYYHCWLSKHSQNFCLFLNFLNIFNIFDEYHWAFCLMNITVHSEQILSFDKLIIEFSLRETIEQFSSVVVIFWDIFIDFVEVQKIIQNVILLSHAMTEKNIKKVIVKNDAEKSALIDNDQMKKSLSTQNDWEHKIDINSIESNYDVKRIKVMFNMRLIEKNFYKMRFKLFDKQNKHVSNNCFLSNFHVNRLLKASEVSYVNHSADFTTDDKIRSTRSNKSEAYKQKIREQWFYKSFDEYLLCGDENADENVYHWNLENIECIDLRESFSSNASLKKIDDDAKESQSQKMQIAKRFKISAQSLDRTRFTLILSLSKIRFTTKFSIVISFAKRRLELILMTDDLDQFIFFVNFSLLVSTTKRRRITKSLSSAQSIQIVKDFSSLSSSIVKRRRVDFVFSSSRFKFTSV